VPSGPLLASKGLATTDTIRYLSKGPFRSLGGPVWCVGGPFRSLGGPVRCLGGPFRDLGGPFWGLGGTFRGLNGPLWGLGLVPSALLRRERLRLFACFAQCGQLAQWSNCKATIVKQLLYHSTLGSREIKKKKKGACLRPSGFASLPALTSTVNWHSSQIVKQQAGRGSVPAAQSQM